MGKTALFLSEAVITIKAALLALTPVILEEEPETDVLPSAVLL